MKTKYLDNKFLKSPRDWKIQSDIKREVKKNETRKAVQKY